jgi:hypothetical protein
VVLLLVCGRAGSQATTGQMCWLLTNPSVHVFANGTVLLAYRGGWDPWHVGVAVAPSWRGLFRVSHEPVFHNVNEDPGIFQDGRGNFHMLTHDFERPTGGHAFSPDGLSWTYAGNAYGSSIAYDDGSSETISRRERPQVLMLDGLPALLFTGVQPTEGLPFTFVQSISVS